MFVIRLQIPKRNKQKRLFTQAHHAIFEKFSSCNMPGVMWQIFRDKNINKNTSKTFRIYEFLLPSLMDAPRIQIVIDFAKEHYKQNSIFITYKGGSDLMI